MTLEKVVRDKYNVIVGFGVVPERAGEKVVSYNNGRFETFNLNSIMYLGKADMIQTMRMCGINKIEGSAGIVRMNSRGTGLRTTVSSVALPLEALNTGCAQYLKNNFSLYASMNSRLK